MRNLLCCIRNEGEKISCPIYSMSQPLSRRTEKNHEILSHGGLTSYRLKFKHRHNKYVTCKSQVLGGLFFGQNKWLTFYLRNSDAYSCGLTASELINTQISSKSSLKIGKQILANNIIFVFLTSIRFMFLYVRWILRSLRTIKIRSFSSLNM